MNSKWFSNAMSELLKSRRTRAFLIACIVLISLALLQANNLTRQTQMCELLEQCKTSNTDLHRMQLALGQAGLSEFEVEDNRLMVPKAQHAKYLQAIAENNAIPIDLREKDETQTSVNPFLSRSQQLALQREQKKKQIREMVIRLPFVEQAWFEMDEASSRSAFKESKQAAVISIQPPENVALSDNHVDTVKRMIGGAVAGLELNEIVVIDLSAGFAHQDSNDPSATQQTRFQRIAFEQQRIYESRIRNALDDYPGVEVSVVVDVAAVMQADQVAVQQPPVVTLPTTTVSADKDMSDAGANGFASIDEFTPKVIEPVPPTPISLVNHTAPREVIEKSYSVAIDVPEHLVYSMFGAPTASKSAAKNQSDYKAALAKDSLTKFKQLETEIVQKVRPVLPKLKSAFSNDVPIVVNLLRNKAQAPQSLWWEQVKEFAIQNWPSAAVLCIGLILLSIVTRKPEPMPSVAEASPDNDQVVLSMAPPQVSINSETRPESLPEVQLSKLIEKDPNAAAKVIESWIRDAG